MKEYELLSGEKVNLKDLEKSEREVVEEFLRRVENDPYGDDRGEYFLLYRLSSGPQALLEKFRSCLSVKFMNQPCYLILRDIVKRAGIKQGIVPDPEAEKKLKKYNPKCSVLSLMRVPEKLEIKRSEIVRLLEKGELEGEKIGNIWFIYKSSIQDYIKRLKDKKKK